MEKVYHELDPIYNEKSEVLLLGSLPSVKSRELGFYYAHSQNRFWRVIGEIFSSSFETKEEKILFLLEKHIALWDVIASCNIKGASDQSIRNVVCNDIYGLLQKTNIRTIFCTGKKAYTLYQKHIYPQTEIEAIYLPSTSPANCAVSYENLKGEYMQIKKALENKSI